MAYKHEDVLRERAAAFVKVLSEAGISAAIAPDSIRDYLIKVSIQKGGRSYGHLSLHYSPKKDRFTLTSAELRDRAIAPQVEACWQASSAPADDAKPPPTAVSGVAAYVDGSWLDGAVGYGVVMLRDEALATELSGRVDDESVQGMRQVGGELQAVYEAIRWCKQNGVHQLSVYYDYEGISRWVTGEWEAKRTATRAYAEAIRDSGVSIRWEKVEAHSGDRWNERADQLAKAGAKQRSAETGDDVDPLVVLSGSARELVDLLAEHGIAAGFQGIINQQAARVALSAQPGTVDLYNTRRRPLSRPYLHGFADLTLQARIETLWRDYLAGNTEDRSAAGDDPLNEVAYYYRVLEPYRDCDFDFSSLAVALDRASRAVMGSGIDTESHRYDFRKLEALYFDLRGG